MAKKSSKPRGITCKAVTVAREDREGSLNAEAYEFDIEDGIVVATRKISPAPNLPLNIITKVTDRLWSVIRVQKTSQFNEV